MKLSFDIIGTPFAKQSARFFRAGDGIRSYQPKKIIDGEKMVAVQVIQQLPRNFKIIDTAIKITKCIYTFPVLKSFSKKKRDLIKSGVKFYKETKPDLPDNLNKGLIDALQGIVFTNDSRIVSMNGVEKVYGFRPGIELELEY